MSRRKHRTSRSGSGSAPATEPVRFLDRDSATRSIGELGEADLRFLNRLIVERLKLLDRARSTALMAEFHRGQRVRFRGPSGQEIERNVVRLNAKTVGILTDDGERWNVAPALLEPA